MSPPAPRPASTVLVLREAAGAPEILMLKRSGRAGFFPHAWVFPGGRKDAGDDLVTTRGRVPGLREDQRGYAVAAVRETFEETGVWLGPRRPEPGLRERLARGEAQLDPALGLEADLDRLRLWSWWVTPEEEPKRYETAFFLAVVPKDEVAAEDRVEVVEHRWITAESALDAMDGESFFLAPPTFRTLEELARFGDLESLWAAAEDRPLHPIMPRLDPDGAGGLVVVLPGDPSYPSATPVPGPTRLVFERGRWWSRS